MKTVVVTGAKCAFVSGVLTFLESDDCPDCEADIECIALAGAGGRYRVVRNEPHARACVDREVPMIVAIREPLPVKCARTACTNLNGRFVHRDLPGLYCFGCAKAINDYAGFDLIDLSEFKELLAKTKTADPADRPALMRWVNDLAENRRV